MNASNADYHALSNTVGVFHLDIVGTVAPNSSDPVPANAKTILLLGPKEPGFWPYLATRAEFQDGAADPIDRWSRRVISALAKTLGGTAVFPFGGPPYAPFISWARRSARAWASPVTLLVHDTTGLFLSFRGAICLPNLVETVPPPEVPCDNCADRPCLSACPVNALGTDGYGLEICHRFLVSEAGRDCMENGCAVRRACPVSKSYGRLAAQSAHHMKAFHP